MIQLARMCGAVGVHGKRRLRKYTGKQTCLILGTGVLFDRLVENNGKAT